MSYIDVKNKKGTSTHTPPPDYSSWLEFWERKKGEKASKCKAYGCYESTNVGGHVIKAGERGKEYILPLCYGHNNKPESESFKAWESDLVPVV